METTPELTPEEKAAADALLKANEEKADPTESEQMAASRSLV